MLIFTLTVILVTILIYKILLEPIRFWNKLGVQHTEWFRHFYFNWLIFLKRQSAADLVQEMYYAVPSTRYHGLHQFNNPHLILKDPELIKQIAIKDFDHFNDRKFTFADGNDPLFGNNLFSLRGQKWREMRGILTPTFTTSKMKTLFQVMDTCGRKCVKHFLEKGKEIVDVDMHDVFTRYTNDVIACCVFGAEVDSLKDPNNEFYLRGREATDLTRFPTNLKIVCYLASPKLSRMLGLKLLPEETNIFFTNLVSNTIKLREEGKIAQMDMIQLLLEAQKEYEEKQEKEAQKDEKSASGACITTKDITSQAFLFFFAGFEAVSKTMCFLAHELALNQDVQQKLRQEIEKVNQESDRKITYDILMGMKYLDMVVSEILRKYPNQIITDRICTKPYVIEPTSEGEHSIHLPIGTAVVVPVYSLHHDPQLFPDPEKFDPERFNDERKAEIKPYAYQPFGVGPRNCIGSRFALMETKLIFFQLLSKFEFVPVEKTKIPLVYKKSVMAMSSEYGFWLGLKRV